MLTRLISNEKTQNLNSLEHCTSKSKSDWMSDRERSFPRTNCRSLRSRMTPDECAVTLSACGAANGYEFFSARPRRSLFSLEALALGSQNGIVTKQEIARTHMGALRTATVIATCIRILTAMITLTVIRILTAIHQAIHISILRNATRALSLLRLKMMGASRLTFT